MISLDEIKNVSFRKANFGGYKPEDVDKFIDDVQFSYSSLLDEKVKLLTEINELRKKIDDYHNEEESIRRAIISAQRFADDSICSANVESKKIVKDASHEAAAIIFKAKDKAQQELEQAQNLRNQVIKFKNDIISAYKEHLSLITNLPEPVFVNLEKDKSSDFEDITDINISNDVEPDALDEFSNTQKINEDLFSSEDLEQRHSELRFGKNYDINAE
ncbi:MAG: DivIVA domain-containing protein [Oscillospiraceae bacterium]|jgi:DivIVA domain-containing protein|nr:DivIVA domain-containing protein [Oscillospiraceae bacterium]